MHDGLDSIHRWPQRVMAAAFYLVSSFLLLYPVLSTPVVADDFLNPFSQTSDAGSSLSAALRYGWRGATEGASFRIVGNTVGSAYNWLWLTLSARLDISMSTLYGATKFIVLVTCAASIARFWWVSSTDYGRGIRYWDALVLTSLALFGTLQLHIWSNDPVDAYPLAGFGSAALGFAVLTSAVLCNRRRTWRSYLMGTGVAVVACLYYELNVGAVMGAALILLAGSWALRRERRQLLLHLARSGIFVAAPAVGLLYGRLKTASNAAGYSGADLRASRALRTFFLGVGGVLPGSGWRMSNRILGGRVALVSFVFGLVLLLGWLMRWWAKNYERAQTEVSIESRLPRIALVLATGIYLVVAVALQALTIKVQDEMLELGFVYTYYAIGACVVALGIAVAARSILFRPGGVSSRIVLCVIAVLFLTAQSTINWRLSDRLNGAFLLNHRLLDSFDRDVEEPRRCDIFAKWSAGPWPPYYRDGMQSGLQKAYQYYFDEPFCAPRSDTG